MDAGAAWTWYLVHEASKGKVEVEYDAATLLLEVSFRWADGKSITIRFGGMVRLLADGPI